MATPSWIGQTLNGRYQIEELLGQGGMSSVYKATDPNLRRVVAVKMIHSHLSDNAEFVRRFEEEAAAVAQLRHPHIVQVFDFDHDGDAYYIVFEFVPGEPLDARLKRLSEAGRTMPLEEVYRIAGQVGQALDYAHQRGLVHRDIKPANVLLNVHNDAILTDFGIVKITGGTQHTATGAVLGTAQYMSPEQIRGTAVDARTDIYALGVTLFEMVGGRPPFSADSAMTLMMMHVTDPVPDLTAIRADAPPALVAVIEKALTKDPEQRYQSASDLMADLRRAQEGKRPAAPAATIVDDPLKTQVEPEPEAESSPPRPTSPPKRERPPAASPSSPTVVDDEAETAYPAPPPPMPAASGGGRRNLYLAGGVIGVVILIALGLFFGGVFGGVDDDEGVATETPAVAVVSSPAGEETVEAPSATIAPTTTAVATATTAPPTATATATALPTDTPPPSETPPPTNTPPPTAPPGRYVRINEITIEDGRYVVAYETFQFTEQLPGTHIHFFFNTVTPENAGAPGSGPWILYGGPRPFTEYGTADRPAAADAMCALVANPDHSVIQETGNCYRLPDAPAEGS